MIWNCFDDHLTSICQEYMSCTTDDIYVHLSSEDLTSMQPPCNQHLTTRHICTRIAQ
jgi:hypothetical protein